MKCCIISAVLWLKLYGPVCYLFLYTKLSLKLWPWLEFTNEASQVQLLVGKSITSHCSQWRPIFICVAMVYSLFIVFFFSYLPSVAVHDLNFNVKHAWKNLCTIGILSNKDSLCLEPFSSNISCGPPQRFCLVARIRTRVPYVSQRYCIVIFQWGTQ